MDKDIAPGLIENVNKAFENNCMKDGNMQAMVKKLETGAASYEDAYKYAVSVGNARAKAFKNEISSDILPDGRMYYNIADRLMNDSLGTDHDMVADYAAGVQDIYNQKAGISLKAQKAELDESRIKGFVDRLDSEDNFDDVAWILDEPVKVHAMSVVDDTIKKNAEFQGKAGLKATVIRDAKSDCCGWCTDLAGDYTYPKVPGEVFARHDNCRCTLEYEGRKLSAYESGGKAHSFRDQGEQEKTEKKLSTANENESVKINKDVLKYRKLSNEGAMMEYRSVFRDENNRLDLATGGETINASLLIDSKNGIYISDNTRIKPKELDRIEKQIDNARKQTGIHEDNGVKYVIVSDTELYKATGGRFDADTNTIFIKQLIDKDDQAHMIMHEHFHCKDLQEYIRSGYEYKDKTSYITFMCDNAKQKLEKKGINAYNVGEISDYAERSFRIGRYDETYTELRTVDALKRK